MTSSPITKYSKCVWIWLLLTILKTFAFIIHTLCQRVQPEVTLSSFHILLKQKAYLWSQVLAEVPVRSALFWDFSDVSGQPIGWADRLSRNVGNRLQFYAAQNPKRVQVCQVKVLSVILCETTKFSNFLYVSSGLENKDKTSVSRFKVSHCRHCSNTCNLMANKIDKGQNSAD